MAHMIIDGKPCQAISGHTLEVRSPVDGKVFDHIPRSDARDIDLAVRAARAALNGAWGQLSATERGRLMQQACESSKGAMAAVIGGSREDIAKLCVAFDIQAANFNCPGQVVISGEAEKVNAAVARAKEFGPFKLVKALPVAGAYHSRLMEPARAAFEKFLQDIPFNAPKLTVYTNTTGEAVSEPSALRAALAKQVVSSVYWEDNCRAAAASGITRFYECGPGAVLAGMMKRTAPEAPVTSIAEFAEIPA
jgi:[acyl-carrier-protein] S-malonyltransferase